MGERPTSDGDDGMSQVGVTKKPVLTWCYHCPIVGWEDNDIVDLFLNGDWRPGGSARGDSNLMKG